MKNDAETVNEYSSPVPNIHSVYVALPTVLVVKVESKVIRGTRVL
jgi:hypothetical protein